MRYKYVIRWLLLIVFFCLVPVTVWATPPRQSPESDGCAVEYTVQADDWLSKLAGKYLDDVLAYPAIFQTTNQHNAMDQRFARISDSNVIEVGWLLCIPSPTAASDSPVSSAWQPLPPPERDALAAALAQQFKVEPKVTTANFYASSPMEGTGTGCQLSLQETNQVFQVEDGLDLTEQVDTLLTPLRWTLDPDSRLAASAFTEVNSTFNQGYAQCQISIRGNIAPDVQCPEILGTSSCFFEQPPEKQIYSLQLTCAQLPH